MNMSIYNLLWVVALGASAPAFGRGVYINELMYQPHPSLGDADDYQWVELYNATDEIVYTGGWTLNDFELPNSRVAPHGFMVIARQDVSDPDQDGEYYSRYYNRGNDFPHHQVTIVDAEGADLGLGNDGRVYMELRDDQGVLQDRSAYHSSMGGDADGSSLEKTIAYRDHEDVLWHPSRPAGEHGTAGLQNSTVAVRMHIESEREAYVVGEELRIVTWVINRSPYPVRGQVTTYLVRPDESESVIEEGVPIVLRPGTRTSLTQSWAIPPYPDGLYLVKQVSFGQEQSVAPELMEFTLGAQYGSEDEGEPVPDLLD